MYIRDEQVLLTVLLLISQHCIILLFYHCHIIYIIRQILLNLQHERPTQTTHTHTHYIISIYNRSIYAPHLNVSVSFQ